MSRPLTSQRECSASSMRTAVTRRCISRRAGLPTARRSKRRSGPAPESSTTPTTSGSSWQRETGTTTPTSAAITGATRYSLFTRTEPASAPAGSGVAHLGAQSGKDGQIRLLNLDNLSGLGSPALVAGELQKIAVPQGGGVLTAPAVWVNPVDSGTWLFLANSSGISGLQLTVDVSGAPSLVPRWTSPAGGTSPVVANGIVYYAGTAGLRGLDPTTGSQLWSDVSIGGIHWESPIVVQGRLYITDENGTLWAFEPAPAPLRFHTLAPCRVGDARGPGGTWG